MLTTERIALILKRRRKVKDGNAEAMKEIREDLNKACDMLVEALAEVGQIYSEDVDVLLTENTRLNTLVRELQTRTA